jgi:integrin alpha FG-GAP repeat containing protein 1
MDTTFSPPLPLPVRLGDTDLDGFPELLVIAATADRHTPKLLISEPCTKGLAGCEANGQGRRGFSLLQKGAESLETVYDARGVTFMDMDEDVRRFCLVSAREHNTPVPNRGHLMLSYRERERRVMAQ